MDSQRTIDLCDRTMVFAFFVLIFFLPVSTALTEISFGFILLGFLTKVTVTRYLVRRGCHSVRGQLRCVELLPASLRNLLWAFVAANFLSVLFSQNFSESIQAFYFKFLECVILTLAFVEAFKRSREIKIWLGLFFISCLLSCVEGYVQFWRGYGLINHNVAADGRITSFFGHPNDFASYLIVVLPLLWGMTWYKWGQVLGARGANFASAGRSVALTAISLAVLVCLGLTYSRAAWIALPVGLLIMGLFRKGMLLVFALIISVFFVFFVPRMVEIRNVSFISDNAVGKGHNDVASISPPVVRDGLLSMESLKKAIGDIKGFGGMGRTEFWRQAWAVYRNHPVFGSGLNTYSQQCHKYISDWNGYYAHNCYLQMAVELGAVGLVVFWAFIAGVYCFAVREWGRVKDRFLQAVLLGAMGSLTAFLFHGFFDTNMYSVRLLNLMWLILGVIVAVPLVSRHQLPITKKEDPLG